MVDKHSIYLDNNATTPCDPRVVEKMLPYFTKNYGNPANGLHIQGRLASKAVEEAREKVANLIGAQPYEIFFTAGATESDNIAIFGTASLPSKGERKKIVTSAVEHKAVLLPCQKLQEEGFEVVFLPVDSNCRVSIEAARAAINDQTRLVSIQAANNEVGTIQPVAEIAELAHDHGALFHCDAAQAVGKIPLNVNDLNVDLVSISAHKFFGPKGIGAIYVRGGRKRTPIEPILLGGEQENGLRSGTLNVPSIVGFGEASHICAESLLDEGKRISNLRDQLEQKLLSSTGRLHINAQFADRIPNTSSITFQGLEAEELLLNCQELMLGTGSACTYGAIGPSHVLTAMGLSREAAYSTVRLSLGRFNTEEDIQAIVNLLTKTVKVYEVK
jgi:cysteine desulfurase